MSSEKLLIHLNPVQGYNKIFDLGEYNMQLTAFGLIQLAAGTSYRNTTGEFEVALVLLGGKCAVKGRDFAFAEVGGRKSVFDGKPHTVYLPRRTEYEITALTDVDIAYNASPASRDTAVRSCRAAWMYQTSTLSHTSAGQAERVRHSMQTAWRQRAQREEIPPLGISHLRLGAYRKPVTPIPLPVNSMH